MVVDRIDRWTQRTMRLLDSKEGYQIYQNNKYNLHLDRLNNICGIIQKATNLIRWEHIKAVYDRVEAELAARKERVAG